AIRNRSSGIPPSELSLYDAWSQLPFIQNLYEQNRTVISGRLHDRDGWHIVEIGGGNGALWDGYLRTLKRGTLTLIDPNEDAHHALAAKSRAAWPFARLSPAP